MENNSKDKKSDNSGYYFGGIKEFCLEQIESEVLNDTVYLDVFAGSDERLKENIRPAAGMLQKVMHLETVHYQYKTGNNEQVGFSAQQIAPFVPEIVSKDQSGMYQVNYGLLTPTLAGAIKELNAIIEAQGERIASLEKRLGTNQ